VKVSLVATVKDAGEALEPFLESVRAQTRAPDEVVVVDGGSTDGTWERLETAEGLTAIREPGANIARGRNVAVRAAAHDVIAVTDADCLLEPDWLERLLEPFDRGAAVVAGAYAPIALRTWQFAASAHVPDPDELRPGWMPSSRSMAFRREAFEIEGGYPEWLDIGEDMFLNHRWLERGTRVELAPDAVVRWRVRPSLAATWLQYAKYAEGDAAGGMYPERHLTRFAVYGLAFAAFPRRRRWPAAIAAAALLRSARPMARAWRRSEGPDRWKAVALVPAFLAFTDLAKMWGYAKGRLLNK
jgi:glycosyltransferase involved in cell wall biosynthesis